MQAFRTDFALEDGEDVFFDVGVQKSGRSRHKLEHQLRRRKLMLGIGISVGVVGLIVLIVGLAYAVGHKSFGYECPDSFKRSDADLIFFVVSLTRGGMFKFHHLVSSTSPLSCQSHRTVCQPDEACRLC